MVWKQTRSVRCFGLKEGSKERMKRSWDEREKKYHFIMLFRYRKRSFYPFTLQVEYAWAQVDECTFVNLKHLHVTPSIPTLISTDSEFTSSPELFRQIQDVAKVKILLWLGTFGFFSKNWINKNKWSQDLIPLIHFRPGEILSKKMRKSFLKIVQNCLNCSFYLIWLPLSICFDPSIIFLFDSIAKSQDCEYL